MANRGKQSLRLSPALVSSSGLDRKRKELHSPSHEGTGFELQEGESFCPHKCEHSAQKRSRASPTGGVANDDLKEEAGDDVSDEDTQPIQHWIQEGKWPRDYFEQDTTMLPALTRKRSQSSRAKQSETSGISVREGKNPLVRDRLYQKTLANFGIFMDDDKRSITDECKILCKKLLITEQSTPEDTLFQDDIFAKTIRRLQHENESMVVRDISPLIVPPAEILHAFGAEHLEHLTGHVNQGWFGCIPIAPGPEPKPDYSVGFDETAFTPRQLQRLQPYIEGWKRTPFLATAWMHFPFLTAEVKCGNAALEIADRQNIHAASVAVKQVIDLYRAVFRERQLDRKILAFSVSHDYRDVRIYGHYAVIDGATTRFYRRLIDEFSIVSRDGKDKWTAYQFVKNVYDIFVPTHLERIRSALDQLPDPTLHQPSQQLSSVESASQQDQNESQPSVSHSQDVEPETPSSHAIEPMFKKPRSRDAG